MEDYERANAREWDLHYHENETPHVATTREWQNVGRPTRTPTRGGRQPLLKKPGGRPQGKPKPAEGRTKPPGRRRPPPNLVAEADNTAQLEWRSHAQPKDSVRIPEDMILADAENKTHELIARQRGTFIFSEHSRGMNGSVSFGIWGEGLDVAATKEDLIAWINENKPSKPGGHRHRFPKVMSLTDQQKKKAESKWHREVKRASYRQHPPSNFTFGAIGSFQWPIMEHRPEEILGASHEALDPIRMELKCYVVFSNERSAFQVLGESKPVQQGLLRLRKTCFQIAARQCNPVRKFLLHWPQPEANIVPTHVYLEPYESPRMTSADAPEPKVKHCPRAQGGVDGHGELEQQNAATETSLRKNIAQLLARLHYFRGNIQMRFRLGRFLATRYKQTRDGMYELSDYETMIQASQFDGALTKELGDKDLERQVLLALQESQDFLVPEAATIEDLSDVKPVYSATFTFADAMGDLRLVKSWQQDEEQADSDPRVSTIPSFTQISEKWTRLERDTGVPSSLLDVHLTDLVTGFSWQCVVDAAQAVDKSRLASTLRSFSDSLSIDPRAAYGQSQNPERSFVIFKPQGVQLKSFQQRTSYRYDMSGYVLELSCFQDRSFPAGTFTSIQASAEPTVHEPRWSLEVFHNDWDQMFTRNERLDVGMSADWEDDVKRWFPEDIGSGSDDPNLGFQQLMRKLEEIKRLVRGAKLEDLMGGMTVG